QDPILHIFMAREADFAIQYSHSSFHRLYDALQAIQFNVPCEIVKAVLVRFKSDDSTTRRDTLSQCQRIQTDMRANISNYVAWQNIAHQVTPYLRFVNFPHIAIFGLN